MRKTLNIVIILVVILSVGVLNNITITTKKLEKSTYFSGENVISTENEKNIAEEKRKSDTKLKNTMHFISAILMVLTIIFIIQNIRYKDVI